MKIPVALSNLPTTQLARPVFSPFKLTPFQLNPFLTATQMIGRLVYTRKKEDCCLALTLLLGLLADSTDCLPCLTTLTKLKAERFLLFGRESVSNGCRWWSSKSFVGGGSVDIERRDIPSPLLPVGTPNGATELLHGCTQTRLWYCLLVHPLQRSLFLGLKMSFFF